MTGSHSTGAPKFDMPRQRLPERRDTRTGTLDWAGFDFKFHVTVGFRADGRAAEVFAVGPKPGTELRATIEDGCVMASLLLQHGYTLAHIAGKLSKAGEDGPGSAVAAIVRFAEGLEAGFRADVETQRATGPRLEPDGRKRR